jgi:hypothetical protein
MTWSFRSCGTKTRPPDGGREGAHCTAARSRAGFVRGDVNRAAALRPEPRAACTAGTESSNLRYRQRTDGAEREADTDKIVAPESGICIGDRDRFDLGDRAKAIEQGIDSRSGYAGEHPAMQTRYERDCGPKPTATATAF